MVYFKFIEILTMLCIINTTIALKCWFCSSGESDSKFCGKLLDETNLTRYQKAVNLVNCYYTHFEQGRDLITKCIIQKTSNNGKIFYSRSCIWEDRNSGEEGCLNLPPPYGHRMEACETCVEDKCNYELISDHNVGSTHLLAMYQIMFICLLVIALHI